MITYFLIPTKILQKVVAYQSAIQSNILLLMHIQQEKKYKQLVISYLDVKLVVIQQLCLLLYERLHNALCFNIL